MDNKPIRILLIEDNAGDARIIQEQLKEIPEISYIFQRVSQLQEGLAYLNKNETDVVLSDLSLPDSPGLETFNRLQTEISKIPVVVVTGFDNESAALDAVREGAQDYLIKGQIDARGLSRTILYAIERHRTQSTLRSLSLTDELTGLYNRRGFLTLGEQALKSAQRAKSVLSLYYADLDGLKKINDAFGHPNGDKAIAGAAEVLRKTFRQSDIVARIGGDEFAILAAEDQAGGSEILISRLHANVGHYNLQNPRPYKVSISVGVAQFNPKAPVLIEELLSQADKVLYVSKGKKVSPMPALNRTNKYIWALAVLAGGPLAGVFFKTHERKQPVPPASIPTPVVVPVSLPVATPVPRAASTKKAPSTPAPSATLPLVRALPIRPSPPIRGELPVAAPSIALHRELIPKDITITHFSYAETIVPPGTIFTFKIAGSGFTSEFQKVLVVYSGSPHIQIKNMRLITVNEIRGEMVIHPDAPTQYVLPRVLIDGTPVFQAANPFAIIRLGDVLNIVFTKMEENGHAGYFRVYTHLDPELARHFHVVPGLQSLEILPLEFNLPYRVEGVLRINDSVPHGEYALSAFLGGKEVFRKDRMIQVTRPTLGSTGFVQKLLAQERFRRPGDSVRIQIQGTGFTPGLAGMLTARVEGLEKSEIAFRYVSPGRLEGSFEIPKEALEKSYSVTLFEGREVTLRTKDAFIVVPSNWIDGFTVNPPARTGRKSVLKIVGRDFSHDFARTLQLETDEPGIHLARPLWVNASTLTVQMNIDDAVTPGDYMINLKSEGFSVKPQGGNLITVSAP